LVLADTGITLNVERIEAGQTYTIIDPSASIPKTISIWCETPAGEGYYAATVSP
jgi:pantoate kinase